MLPARNSLLGDLLSLNAEARRDAIAAREFGASLDFLAEQMIAVEAVDLVGAMRTDLTQALDDATLCRATKSRLLTVMRGLELLAQ